MAVLIATAFPLTAILLARGVLFLASSGRGGPSLLYWLVQIALVTTSASTCILVHALRSLRAQPAARRARVLALLGSLLVTQATVIGTMATCLLGYPGNTGMLLLEIAAAGVLLPNCYALERALTAASETG